jgi:hypothetical protein
MRYQGDPGNPPCSTFNPRQFSSGQPGASGVPFTALVDGIEVTISDGSRVTLNAGDIVDCLGEVPVSGTPVNRAKGTPKAHTPTSEVDPAVPGFGCRGLVPGRCVYSNYNRMTGAWDTVEFAPPDGTLVLPEHTPDARELALYGAARQFTMGAISGADLEQAARDFAAS